MRDQKKAEGVALQLVQLLSQLWAESLDAVQTRQIKARICKETAFLNDEHLKVMKIYMLVLVRGI